MILLLARKVISNLRRRLSAIVVSGFVIVILLSPADAQGRYALVIGNKDYPAQPGALMNPHLDAELIARALRSLQFDVVVRRDLSHDETVGEVRKFGERLAGYGPEAIGFFYYSGHGASAENAGQRRNYLMPARETISSGGQLAFRGVPLDYLIDILAAAKAKAVFFVSDACRNTLPWSEEKGGERSKAFADVASRSGLFISFAAADGQTTPDDGYFAKQIAHHLVQPGQFADRAFTLANREVAKRRSGGKLPFVSDALAADICLASSCGAVGAGTNTPPAAVPVQPLVEEGVAEAARPANVDRSKMLARMRAAEPIAGAGLAICLAYLALGRFRYRYRIEDAARNSIHALHKAFGSDAPLRYLASYRMLERLANLPVRSSPPSVSLPRESPNVDAQFPEERDYRRFFVSGLDRIVTMGFATYLIVVLMFGVLLSVFPSALAPLPDFLFSPLFLLGGAIGGLYPLAAMFFGQRILRRLERLMKEVHRELAAFRAHFPTTPGGKPV